MLGLIEIIPLHYFKLDNGRNIKMKKIKLISIKSIVVLIALINCLYAQLDVGGELFR